MSFTFVPKDDQHKPVDQWAGFSAVVPLVSVGNVPQLTMDLMINTLLKGSKSSSDQDLEFAGHIRCKYVHPYAGPDAYSPFSTKTQMFSTSIQVFVSPSRKLVLIQQRSPVIKMFKKEFCDELYRWLTGHKFSLILLLSSSFDHYVLPELNQTRFLIKYLTPIADQAINLHLERKLNLTPIVKVDPETMKPDPEKGKFCLSGSGLARSLLKLFSSAADNKAEVACLVMFCSEGDNRPHSFQMANTVAEVLNWQSVIIANVPDQWSVPFSWRNLFGDEPPAELF